MDVTPKIRHCRVTKTRNKEQMHFQFALSEGHQEVVRAINRELVGSLKSSYCLMPAPPSKQEREIQEYIDTVDA